ncbi:MAG: molybdopterin cofactor-binding domain-containing protein, partial [Pseudomonadota bacterium]
RTIVANEERAIGIAYSDSYEGYLAAAISVSISDGQLHLHDVWVVADVGMMVDPETVQRQISGGLYFGLGPALDGDMQVEEAMITGENFGDIGALYGYAAPPVHVTLIDNPDAPPAGVGEIGTPLIAPALCNAIVAAGGPRVRTLPVSKSELVVQT